MRAFTTTIDTLYDMVMFVSITCVEWCVGIFSTRAVESAHTTHDHEEEVLKEVEEPSFKAINEIIDAGTRIQKNTVMYANSIRVPVYKNPTIEFDTQIGEIPYGEMVIVLEPRGRFYRIMWDTTEGWVLRDDIADRALRVHPEFVPGEENSVDHPNTAHVRAILGDPFSLGKSDFPLQSGEYVLYRLWKKGIRISWPQVRPRVPGIWHKILRGASGIHIGVTPKVGSIMEYVLDGDVGHLAYVEAVYPDDTITVSEVNYPDSGTYSERELTKEKWKGLKPLFITVERA